MLNSVLQRIGVPSVLKFSGRCATFSTSQNLQGVRDFRVKWVVPEKWKKLKSGNDAIPWLNCLPFQKNPNEWTKEKAYFGMYDYLPILGNDVSIEHKMFCRGPGYVRAYNENELRRLLHKRSMLGYRMHVEDLHTLNKRIRFLMKVENRRKSRTHG